MAKLGVEKRAENRVKKLNAVAKKSTELFNKQFPNPALVPSNSVFSTKWKLFIRELNETFGSLSDYRYAFNRGINTVKANQQQHNWNVEPPSYIVSDKPPKQLRTQTWQKNAWRIHAFYEEWFQVVHTPVETSAIDTAYRNLMLSFIFHSGHCVKEIVLAFEQCLQEDSLPLESWDAHPFVTLTLAESADAHIRFNTNVYHEDQAVTQFHCYLQPITLGLLRHWLRHKRNKEWSCPKNWNERMQALTQNKLDMPAQSFLEAAVYVCEQHKNVELSQALVECQIARTKTYGLPKDNLARLAHPHVALLKDVQFKPTPSSNDAPISQTTQTPVSIQTDLYKTLKEVLTTKTSSGRSITSEQIKKRLSLALTLLPNNAHLGERALLEWYQAKLQTCTTGTIRSYHYSLTRKWLYLCSQHALHTLDADELESIYQNAIEAHATEKSKRYFVGRLKELHAFCVSEFQFPRVSMALWSQDQAQAHTRAGFVDESLFVALLNNIEQTIDLSEADKLCLKTLCIFSYRGGLRLLELRKLRIKDIEPSSIGWTYIRDTHIAKNKTASSLRKVPMMSMLLPHELDIVERYYQSKIEVAEFSSRLPFFSLGADAKMPIVTFQVSMYVGRLLKSLSQLDYLVFHHLRHSAISRLQVILECDEAETHSTQIVRYGKEQRQKIRLAIIGRNLKNGYDQIASFAGHESPSMTFSHYFHFSDWIVGQKLRQATFNLTKLEANKLGLIPMDSLTQMDNGIEMDSVMHYLHSKLHIQKLIPKISEGQLPTFQFNPISKEVISIPICYKALTLIEQGFKPQEVCERFKLKPSTLKKWLANAHFIKSLSYTKGDQTFSRHFTASRASKLLPASLKTELEIVQFNRYISQFKAHYKDKAQSISHAIDYALHNCSTSQSGVHFNSPVELKTFIDTCKTFIPKSHWCAMTHYVSSSIIKEEWRDSFSGIQSHVARQSEKRSKKAQGAVQLKLVTPKTHQSDDSKRPNASPVVHYLFHMIGILIGNYST